MTLMQTVYEGTSLQLTSLTFLYLLLPLSLLVFYLSPTRFRPGVLLGISLYFYFLVEPKSLWIILLSVAMDYLLIRLMERAGQLARLRKILAAALVVKNLGLIVGSGVLAQYSGSPQILGLQIYTLGAISAALSVYRREISPQQHGIVRFGLYCCFFPRLFAGPLVEYQDFRLEEMGPVPHFPRLFTGLGQFIQGAFKHYVLGGNLFVLYRAVATLPPEDVTVLSSWCRVFSVAFALYFMLSGFSDMAKGLGGLFGIPLPDNFHYPYQSGSMRDFSLRFNLTVGQFIRRHVYDSLQGDKNRLCSDMVNIALCGMLSGLWFGLRLNYLLWGVYLALFYILEKYWYGKALRNLPSLLCGLITICIVMSSFTIFSGESVSQSLSLIGSMFRYGSFFNEKILYLLSSNWLLLIVSVILSTNALHGLVGLFRKAAPAASVWVLGVLDVGILVILTSMLL